MSDFVHLHCHTEYSLLDGAIKIKDLCAKAIDFGLPAAAITDHGNLFGSLIFYTQAKSMGLKPIVGCEVYVAPNSRTDRTARSASEAGYHLVLLAMNRQGWKNLIKLVTRAHLEGFHYKPRVDKELLLRWNEGLIALSACLSGEVPYLLRHQGMDAGLAAARRYAEIFPDRFYLELQANGLPEQDEANKLLLEASDHLKLPLVATNDCHYLTKADAEAQDVLICIQTNACVDDEKRMRFGTDELYYRSPEEMEKLFGHIPQSLENTVKIAERCDLDIELGKLHFPVYTVPDGLSLEDEFKRLTRAGLEERLAKMPYEIDQAAYRKRLEHELEIIADKGFAGYFLIVQDFINWAKDRGIPVGPGRGSAAGSLCAYALKITNLDPIRYNLLFERFLNVERLSMPDIDVDFCFNRREEAIKYVTDKYGHNSVAQITTFGTMKAKAAVKDVGRALGMAYNETDRIAKLIPEDLKMTIAKALDQEPELRTLVEGDPRMAKLIDISRRLEGLSRHASTHAAGVVISDKPMIEYLPLYRGKRGEVVTQYDMKYVEKVGLIKFDFLGLKTLTVIDDAVKMVIKGGKRMPHLDVLPLDDDDTYKLLSQGRTDGVFQLESSGMRRVLMDLKPTCFEDIIALLALYRPGPLESGMVDDFVKSKHGLKEVEYALPQLEPILKETYGVILYQEQVMKIASVLAGYSMGEGDLLRRAMGKKKPEEMAAQRTRFMDGARDGNIPEDKASYIFDLMEKFAGYGFNKSHSAAYALISYQTAYIKAHFPVEFMAALITSEITNQDKILKYVNSCREMDIKVLQPDVNKSFREFSVENECIRYGLGGVKSVGDEAINDILEQRTADGEFKSLLDFCTRVNMRKVTKRVLENLIKSGALDCLGCSRASMIAAIDRVTAKAQRSAKEKNSGQLSLFALAPEEEEDVMGGLGLTCEESAIPEWPDDEKLRYEKEALGFYLSSHPLWPYRHEIRRLNLSTLADAAEAPSRYEIRVACLVTGKKELTTKKGDRMAFCNVDDLTGFGEVIMFPDVYRMARPLLEGDRPLIIEARVDEQKNDDSAKKSEDDDEAPKQARLLAISVSLLTESIKGNTQAVEVSVDGRDVPPDCFTGLRAILVRYPGDAPVVLTLRMSQADCVMHLGSELNVCPTQDMWREIENWRKETTSVRGNI